MSDIQTFLVDIGKSEKTAKNYAGALKGVISSWAAQEGLVKQSIFEIDDLVEYESLAARIRQLPIYEARNTVGKGMYNAALNSYADYIAQSKGTHLSNDLAEIMNDTTIADTEKQSLVNTRIGQGAFRNLLIEQWQGCAVTGYRNSRLLVASHIKPWRHADNSERLDQFNGLLLLPNLDKAFDLGLITFGKDGALWKSQELEQPEILGVNDEMRIELHERHLPYMQFHHSSVFRR